MSPCFPHFRCLLLAVLLAVTGRAAETPAATDFDQVMKPFLEEHCTRCHGEKKHKGELRLDILSRDFVSGGSAMHWADAMDRISSGEMPPEEEPQPKITDAARMVEWLAARLKEGESARLAKRERVSFHKLTREEYANTIYDLLGVHYDATDPTGLLEDPNWNGFERIGSVLSLSPAHVEKYFTAAEGALAEALPVKAPTEQTVHWGAFDLRGSSKMSVDDRAALQSLAKQSKAADYRLPAIVEALVLSDLFQKR